MKCPKCRSEVGNQPVCPYCGGTVYIQGVTWTADEYGRRTTMPVSEMRGSSRGGYDPREMDRRLRGLELKANLTLILQCGIFALVVLALVVLALK